MLTINFLFILRKSDNYSVNHFSNQNMNPATMSQYNTVTQQDNTHKLFLAIDVWLAYICCWIFEKIPDKSKST